MSLKKLMLAVSATALLTGCGSGGSGGGGSTSGSGGSAVVLPTPSPSPTPTPTPSSAAALGATVQFAQTHVMPAQGINFTFNRTGATNLHLTGGKPTLALVRIAQSDAAGLTIEARRGTTVLGSAQLAPPASLPASEAGSDRYATDLWSADLQPGWIEPDVSFVVKASNYAESAATTPVVGANSELVLRLLPVYLFGATPANSVPLSQSNTIPAARRDEAFAKWPVAALDISGHPAQSWTIDQLVIPPRQDSAGVRQPAYVARTSTDFKDGFAGLSATLSLLLKMREANGEGPTNALWYSPLVALNSAGQYRSPGGGLGSLGGGASNGDADWGGLFFHEVGHTYILDHSADAFSNGDFPYANGTLNGSAWGYDAGRREFLSTVVPTTASSAGRCASNHQTNAAGRCYKQDPMQGGAGDQASGYGFTMFADANVAIIQRWFEGVTTAGANGNTYSGGMLFPNGVGRWTRWDSIARRRVAFTPVTTNSGQFGVNNGLPETYNVPVHTIALTIGNAGTAGSTRIYQPISFTGNLLRLFDPTVADDRAQINPTNGPLRYYCVDGGCDYTLRVTYNDGSMIHRVLQDGFRPFNQVTAAPTGTRIDPLEGDSQRSFAINVPGGKAITRIELLSTPMVWQGMPANPVVLASR